MESEICPFVLLNPKIVERKGKNRQLHRTKAGSEKDLEVVPSRSYFAWNWSPRSDIEKIERLAEEFRCKE